MPETSPAPEPGDVRALDGEALPRPRSAPLAALWRWLPLGVVLCLAAAALLLGWHRYLTIEALLVHEASLRAFVEDHYAGALLAYGGLYVAAVALSLPGGLLLTLAGGFLFGWMVGGLVTVIAATLGATIVFLIARTAIGAALSGRAGPRLAALRRGFRDNAMSYLLFLRLVPVFPFWLVNIAPALLGVPLPTYVAATLIGIVPGTFAFAFAGVGLDSVVDAQRDGFRQCAEAAAAAGRDPEAACSLSLQPSSLLTPTLIAALAVLGVLALLPVVAQKVMGRRGARRGAP